MLLHLTTESEEYSETLSSLHFIEKISIHFLTTV